MSASTLQITRDSATPRSYFHPNYDSSPGVGWLAVRAGDDLRCTCLRTYARTPRSLPELRFEPSGEPSRLADHAARRNRELVDERRQRMIHSPFHSVD